MPAADPVNVHERDRNSDGVRAGLQRRVATRLDIDAELLPISRDLRSDVHDLGPGLITGVADDDPSGIATYTVTGATYGYQLLWMSLVTFPMNFAVQSLCARIGLVTGSGLATVIRRRYGRQLLAPVVFLLLVANIVNIGADLAAIAASIELVTGLPAPALLAPIGLAVALTEIIVPYAVFARYLKLLSLVIFAYVICAFVAGPDWKAALGATVLPRLSFSTAMLATVVAILGTTISPYLFFWQVSQEVEEERERGIVATIHATGQMNALLRAARLDVGLGMAMANIGFYFVVLTAAATLHRAGMTDVETAAQAAQALEPLAGRAASLIFALGIIGTGLLAIPVLAGSAAYATAELFGWKEGLSQRFGQAPQFYGVIALATLLGALPSFTGISEIRALFVAAIVNGLIAPVLLVVIMLISRDRQVLGDYTAGRTISLMGWITTIAMALAALAFLATLF